MSNELVNLETGEVMTSTNNVIRETDDYMIVRLDSGKYEKRMKYKAIATFKPESEEEEIELYKVLNEDDNENVIPMKNNIGLEYDIVGFMTRPYESFNEENGEVTFGVNTYLKTVDNQYIVTSSKTVYFDLLNMYNVFKLPLRVKVTGTKRENGIQIGLSLVGKLQDDILF